MVTGFGKRYSIVYPDGNVEQRTMLGDPKVPGDVLNLHGGTWRVVQSREIVGEELLDYELRVEATPT